MGSLSARAPFKGMVFEVSDHTALDTTRPVISAIAPNALLPSWGLELAGWLSRYYLSSLFEAATLMLPPGFRTRLRAHVRTARERPSGLIEEEAVVYEFLAEGGRKPESAVKKALGRRRVRL